MIDFPDVDIKMQAHNGNYTNPLECYHNCKRRAKAKYCNKPKRTKGKQIIKIKKDMTGLAPEFLIFD